MIDYIFSGAPPAGAPVWGRSFLQPLAPGALTPFSASMLVEIAGSAWYGYFDRLGFSPTPKSRIAKLHVDTPYVNLSLSAEVDARQAGREPVSVRIGGAVRPLCQWEKPGFLAGMKTGRNAKKIDELLDGLNDEIDDAVTRGQAWVKRVLGMRWSQAEILQIMEEIERIGAASLMPYFAARHNLEYAYGRLLMLAGTTAFPGNVALANRALAGSDALVEGDIAHRVEELAALAGRDPAALAWLDAGPAHAGLDTLPEGAFAAALREFVNVYGHRAAGEGELGNPRWSEELRPVLHAIRAAPQASADAQGAPAADESARQRFLAAVDSRQRKEAEQLLQQIGRWLPLQSRALHAYAYVLAGTRHWALAAGREAMGDGRLLAQEDVFFYELEEVKEMMTGEWNVSDRAEIQAAAAARRRRWETLQTTIPGDLLLGEQEARVAAAGLSAAGGQGRGVAVTTPGAKGAAAGSVLLATQPDAGWAIGLPAATGLAVAQGSPLDPALAAAASRRLPVVYGIGEALQTFAAGAQVLVDGDKGQVAHE